LINCGIRRTKGGIYVKKYVFTAFIILLFALSPLHAEQDKSSLHPIFDIEGWEITERILKEFNAPSGKYGTWEIAVMTRIGTTETMTVHLFKGPGPGPFYIPSGDMKTDDRPIGFGATYETLVISGHRALLEVYPYIGKALAIKAGKEKVLCIESTSLSQDELTRAGTILLENNL
jgi:hypothetical protein